MTNSLKKNNKGFTIIEVLIVLAIAGLILLIVFLAVPALQRNSRNTQRKNDAARVLSIISEYQSNNGGKIPSRSTMSGSTATLDQGASTATTTVEVSQFDTVTVQGTVPTPVNESTVYVITGATCSGNTPQTGKSSRNYVAYYNIETSGATQAQCVQS